ncbi:MAG: carbohydrate ABC transporter permease [Anaerolineales bacterium]|nr:carbohydrate ABC transporter permease [Anaerolineales bacterium]MCX7755074.1 carbohydrate ABC transporter permease [Anaerolineales bacterium]MDW8277573.1 carbohydrate ABC transporter permease [Anaerolineales bacterium]
MTIRTTHSPVSGYRVQEFVNRAVIYLTLSIVTLIVVIPLVWMFSTSFKLKSQLFTKEIYWIPKQITLENYEKILNNPSTPIGRWFINSLFVASVTTVLKLVIDSLAGYAYARMDFPGRKQIFGLLIATLFLPGVMFLVPNFVTVANLGMLNKFSGVIIPALASVFGVYFMRQFFESLPKELEEAAAIDGANRLQIFFLVALPLSKPALATLAVIEFLASWNDFLWALLVLKDRAVQTLQPGLRTLQGAYTSEYGLMMAGAVIVAVPVLVLYIFLQRFIVQSVATTGLKG